MSIFKAIKAASVSFSKSLDASSKEKLTLIGTGNCKEMNGQFIDRYVVLVKKSGTAFKIIATGDGSAEVLKIQKGAIYDGDFIWLQDKDLTAAERSSVLQFPGLLKELEAAWNF